MPATLTTTAFDEEGRILEVRCALELPSVAEAGQVYVYTQRHDPPALGSLVLVFPVRFPH